MGHPTRKAPALSHVSNPLLAAVAAFPSPASSLTTTTTTTSLDSPHLEPAASRHHQQYSGRETPGHDPLGLAGIISTEPDDIRPAPAMTPSPSDEPSEPFNVVVGGALAPVHTTPPARSVFKSRTDLHLPSFETLGIAAPHPDRFEGVVGLDGTLANAAGKSMDEPWSATHADSELLTALRALEVGNVERFVPPNSLDSKPAGRAIDFPPIHHYGIPPTPPADAGRVDWKSHPAAASFAESPPADISQAVPAEGYFSGTTSMTVPPEQHALDQLESTDQPPWYAGAVDSLAINLRSAPEPPNSIKVLSHALPTPSLDGHIFSTVINVIQDSGSGVPISPMTWINVFHALPGRFNLADMPRSPPNTPGPAVGGDDYFSQKIFDSAVSIADYQERLPRSPCSVVPPESIDMSIVERYIPPATSNEFSSMFDTNGRSILIDRIIELSPRNGSLLFIYPTKAGAQTFMREYLGPVLDPVLRSMSVVHGISTTLTRNIGSMAAVDLLPDHESFRHRVATLCTKITQGVDRCDRFRYRRPTLTLSYASKQYVRLNRGTWAGDWWTKQEKPRIREALTKHAREAHQRRTSDFGQRQKSSTELLQEVLDGVAKGQAYPPGQEPQNGIEVSVFVIKRTA